MTYQALWRVWSVSILIKNVQDVSSLSLILSQGVSSRDWPQDGSLDYGLCVGGSEWNSSGHARASYFSQSRLDAQGSTQS